eukprot:CAMPEP_0171325614 /NCGR_PEP_ID=MMETSP0816-20121228/116917_1 /TAXON_ID=420281 /ORGANISM="Proboscia inermis, Strain CCAP1064/1" /LENGTH=299 /DNA_ID=CAMNT_0011824831 /DNA_START=46 /DNA_END=945 /DNA_ORIENTATION=+
MSFNTYISLNDCLIVDESIDMRPAKSSMPSANTRLSKYYKTYRYIPAAPRFDYTPFPAGECGDGPNFNLWFKQNSKKRSANGEDRFIYNTFFKDSYIKNGTYIELGAFDGTIESNSRFFDNCLGWNGLLIEGNPENYQKVIESRPFANKMSFAPSCNAAYELENKTIEFYRYPMTNVGLVGHAKTYEGKPTVAVPCGPISPVIEDIFQEGHVNFFSLDVEGSEANVLATIDFKKIHIDVVMIEVQNNHCKIKCEVRDQVRAKMSKEGYKLYKGLVQKSDIYVHPNSVFQISEANVQPDV